MDSEGFFGIKNTFNSFFHELFEVLSFGPAYFSLRSYLRAGLKNVEGFGRVEAAEVNCVQFCKKKNLGSISLSFLEYSELAFVLHMGWYLWCLGFLPSFWELCNAGVLTCITKNWSCFNRAHFTLKTKSLLSPLPGLTSWKIKMPIQFSSLQSGYSWRFSGFCGFSRDCFGDM